MDWDSPCGHSPAFTQSGRKPNRLRPYDAVVGPKSVGTVSLSLRHQRPNGFRPYGLLRFLVASRASSRQMKNWSSADLPHAILRNILSEYKLCCFHVDIVATNICII